MKKHLTYSNVVASIALVFAMTGGAYAAGLVPKNSVNSGSVRNNTLTTSDVKDRSLKSRDFANGQLPAGATGAQGAPGSAKAFGFVKSDGSVDTARSSANFSARLLSTGFYCLKAQGVSIKVLVPVLESSTSRNSESDNEWGLIDATYPGESTNTCNSDEAMVRTWYAVTGAGVDMQHANAGFHVVIE